MKPTNNKVLKFKEFYDNKVEKPSEEEPEDEVEIEVDSPEVHRLEDETKFPQDYYNTKLDGATPKPYRNPKTVSKKSK